MIYHGNKEIGFFYHLCHKTTLQYLDDMKLEEVVQKHCECLCISICWYLEKVDIFDISWASKEDLQVKDMTNNSLAQSRISVNLIKNVLIHILD